MTTAEGRNLKPNDVVQIDPDQDVNRFGGCLLVVTEVKPWGVQGYVKNAGASGHAYYRVGYAHIAFVGHAVWATDPDMDEPQAAS